MGVLSRALELFRGLTPTKRLRARREEALGRLPEATLLYLEAGERREAARLYRVRADAATDAAERLVLIGQAIEICDDPEQKRGLELRRARLALDLARAGSRRLEPSELLDLGKKLEELEQAGLAAEAFALGGDAEAHARALIAAGAVERLEQVLEAEQARERGMREGDELFFKITDLDAAGRRREALELAKRAATDPRLGAWLRTIEQRRVNGPCAELEIDGSLREVAFGAEVTIGRAEATIAVPSPNVSREHALLRRGPSGVEVSDLGSRNGTTLAGARIEAPLTIGQGVELVLGGEVRVELSPAGSGVRVAIGGRSLYAPLGPLEAGPFRIEPAADGWLELSAAEGAVLLFGLRADARVQLCRGDAISERAGGPVRLRVPPARGG